jgi:putative tricarboxylic transport membrane protein
METIGHLWMGFGLAVSPLNLLYCLIGATVGTLVGVLPGIGPLTTIAMLLPITFKLPALPALIMLSGIYYGAHHAGSTTAIMLNMPGEPTSVVICIDGHPMARQGRAGPALCISAIGSFIAGCLSILVIAFCSPLLARVALSFGPPEYCAVVIMALIAASVLSNAPVILTIAMTVLGVLLGCVGNDMISGERRFDFGSPDLADGINFVALAVALFAFADILSRAGQPDQVRRFDKIKGLLPTRADLAASWKPILRGTALGAAFGVLPGTGPLVSSFASYSLEKRLAQDPTRFGHGAIEGVAGPESANNAAAFTHFIPMLTLGIPAGAAMALMLGALMIQGVTPGPQVMTDHPDLFWGVIASMWLGNMMLLVLNLPLIGIWIRLLRVRYRILYPAVLVFCCIGVYSVNNSTFDVLLAGGLGLVGYVFAMLDCPPAPVILGFILGPILEVNLRRTLLISQGHFSVFVTRPISLGFLLLAVALLGAIAVPALRRT